MTTTTPDDSARNNLGNGTPPAEEATGLRIGEVAERSGVTVRMLHHYDQIGLLVPTGRTTGGHREYSSADITRLEAVVALRSLGFPLDDVAALLAGDVSPREALAQQLVAVDESLSRLRQVRAHLQVLAVRLEQDEAVTSGDFLALAQAMATAARPLSRPEIQQRMAARDAEFAAMSEDDRQQAMDRRQALVDALDQATLAALREQQRAALGEPDRAGEHGGAGNVQQ